jgi:anti-sigma regulatory factor (Ser/Thr protein kinase)
MCWKCVQQIHCSPAGASQGRHLVVARLAQALRPDGPDEAATDRALIDDAGLVTAELLANATRACRSRVVLHLTIHHRHIEIAVYDDGPGAPAPRRAREDESGGRGLAIVEALSSAWGTEPADDGKVVWSQLPVRGASSAHLECSHTTAA